MEIKKKMKVEIRAVHLQVKEQVRLQVKEHQRLSTKHQTPGQKHGTVFLTAHGRSQPCQHLNLGLLAS